MITSDAVKYIKKNFNILISNQSIRNLLKLNGFGSYKKIKKPYLSEKNIKERKSFGLRYKNFDFFYWKKVIFSDESKFNLHGSDGNHRVWCFKNERLKKENIQGCKKFGGGNLMVWGCITSEGVGKIIRVSNKINSDQYCNTLYEGLIGTMEKYNLKPSEQIFMQDNATCHTSNKSLKWLKDNNINLITWPKNSSNLDPIENVWDYLDKVLQKKIQCLSKWTNFVEMHRRRML